MSRPAPPAVIVLVGPTGVGKTDVGFHLAASLGAEIVSADSRLVYRLMDIGTAKPGPAITGRVPHHMIDIVAPDRQFTAKEFERGARSAIDRILAGGKPAVVVGGTGLYVRALLRGIFDGPAADPAVRRRLGEEARRRGVGALWEDLLRVDPDKARQVHSTNLTRIVRALEVHELTGKRMSDLEKQARPIGWACVQVGLTRERQELYRRIDQRVDEMFQSGFVDEVRRLAGSGYAGGPVVTKTLGYTEVLRHLDGEIALEEAIRLVKTNTRNFAKRQITWFKREADIVWVDLTGRADYQAVASEIRESLDRLP
ncbi:MAG: tRNA (adenosine(37)-N6)-dimethylallyltransferase MiaA [bacterium]